MSVVTTDAIRKTVLVDFAPAEAFELFTTRASSWWPMKTHSYGGDKVRAVVFEPRVGGSVHEVTDEGTAPWAKITAWEPPDRFVMDWLIGNCAGTEVEVRFSPEGPGARVELEHRGWDRIEDASGRDNYSARLGRRARAFRDCGEEGLKPAQALGPRHRRVRGRRRREHEERRLGQAALLRSELRPLAECAAIGLLADEADRAWAKLDGDPLQPLRRAGEVRATQVA